MQRKTSDIEWYGLALLAIFVAGMLLALFQVYQDNHSRHAAEAADSQHERRQEIFDLCQQKPGALASDCLAQAHQAYPEDKNAEYDLEAQQDMAEATWVIVCLSVVGTIISGFGLWAIYSTLHEQRAQFAAERRPWIHFRNIRVVAITVGTRVPELHTKGTHSLRVRVAFECVHSGDSPALNFRRGAVADTAQITEESYPIQTVRRHHAHTLGERGGRLFPVGDTEEEELELIVNFTPPQSIKAWATVHFYFAIIATYRGIVPGLGTLETIQSYALRQLHPGGQTRFALNYWDILQAPASGRELTLKVDPWGYSNAL